MAVLPAGFALPPVPYLVALVVAGVVVAGALRRIAPAVTAGTVLGLAPWMVVGSALHVWYVLDAAPAAVAPLFGAPAVYATVFVCLGAVWAVAASRSPSDSRAVARWLGVVGAVVFGMAVAAVVVSAGSFALRWPAVGLAASLVLTAVTWGLLRRTVPGAGTMGWPGVLAVFAHALDGVSTAIGVDVLGFGERTPLSAAIMDVAAGLPTAELIGVGWLFVLVKLAVAALVVVLFTDYVEEAPRQGYLLLALVVAVGLGPGVHNLLLYVVAG